MRGIVQAIDRSRTLSGRPLVDGTEAILADPLEAPLVGAIGLLAGGADGGRRDLHDAAGLPGFDEAVARAKGQDALDPRPADGRHVRAHLALPHGFATRHPD